MSDIALLWCTFASAEEAERVATAVVEAKLAACANVMAGCASIYRWNGDVHRGAEVPVLFKTTPMLVRRLRDRIAALHSYDLPVIEAWPASVSPAVLEWVSRETG